MNIKQLSLSLLTLLVLTASVIPSTVFAVEVSGDVYGGISSMYLWRGDDLSAGEAVFQSGVDLSVKGLTFSYWSNYNQDNGLDETDIVIDYTTDLSELVSVSIGNILYSVEGSDTNEVYLGLGFNTLLAPELTVYYDTAAAAGDLFVTAAISHSFDLQEGLGLTIGGLVSYIDTAVVSDLHNFELSAGLDYAITEQLTISPSVIFSTPLSDDSDDLAYGDGIDDEFMGGLTLTLSF